MFSENPQPAQGVSSITQRRDGDQYTVRRHKSTPHSQPVSSRYGKAQSIHFSGWEAALPAHFVYFCSGTLGKWVLVIQKKLLLLSPSPSLPLGLSPPFFWFPADIEVQFSATRPPGETPSTPEGQRWGSNQCATWARKAEQSRRGRRREGGGERAHIHSTDGFPLYPHLTRTLSPRHILCREAGRKGRELRGSRRRGLLLGWWGGR